MKPTDMMGTEVAIGDTVVTDVTSYKHTRLQAATVTGIDGHVLTLSYTPSKNWGGESPRPRVITRAAGYVAKVSA